MEVKNVAILGAGAMGSVFAARFHATPGFNAFIVARGQRGRRLAGEGLWVNGEHFPVPVLDPDDKGPTADLVIVGLKNHHLAEALPDLKNFVGDRTAFISIMNGLDSEEAIGRMYGPEKVLLAISVGIDAVRENNRVSFSNPGLHYFGEPKNDPIGPRAAALKKVFDQAGIATEIPPDMVRMLWWKFMINVGMNQASAVTRGTYGVFQRSGEARALMRELMDEVIALAEAARVDLSPEVVGDWEKVLGTLGPDGKTSMLQDVEAGRKTEIEVFGQKVVELGEKYGIPTPVNRAVTHIIKVIESR